MPIVIPDKTYFKIGEVSKLLDVKPYILRYWESEFRPIRPQKSRSKHRLYRRRDVEILIQIRELLYQKKYTIAGARACIDEMLKDKSFTPGKSGLSITESELETCTANGEHVETGQVAAIERKSDGTPSNDDAEKLRSELSKANAELAELALLREQVKALREQNEFLGSQSTTRADKELRAELAAQASELAELRAAVKALSDERSELASKLNMATSAMRAVQDERDALVATRERLREKLRSRKDEHQLTFARTEELEAAVKAMSAVQRDLEAQLRASNDRLRKQAAELKLAAQGSDAAITLRSENEALKTEAAQYIEHIDEMRSQLSELEEAFANAEFTQNELEGTIVHRDKEIALRDGRIEELILEKEELLARIHKNAGQSVVLEELRTRNANLDEELATQTQIARALNRDLRSRLIELSQFVAHS